MSELMQIATDYALAIKTSWEGGNPEWANYDLFFANIVSLIDELADETGLDVHLVALDHHWQTRCFGTGKVWFDLDGFQVEEGEVCAMVSAGAWMVLSDGMDWNFKGPVLQ